MKVEIAKKCFTGIKGNMFPGEVHDLPDRIAGKLLAGGYAVEIEFDKPKRGKKKLTNRAVDASEIETPEGE